jgi:hypothetical protein
MSNTRLKMELVFYRARWRHEMLKRRQKSPTKARRRARERSKMWRDLSRTLRELLQIPGYSAGAYRPDLHYMRGPGPKWRAKYGSLTAKTPAVAPSRSATLRDAVEHRA